MKLIPEMPECGAVVATAGVATGSAVAVLGLVTGVTGAAVVATKRG